MEQAISFETDCHAIAYLPSGETAVYALHAYRVIGGVIEYIPRHGTSGEPVDSICMLLGTVEVRNGWGISFNEAAIDALRAKLSEKKAFDDAWTAPSDEATTDAAV